MNAQTRMHVPLHRLRQPFAYPVTRNTRAGTHFGRFKGHSAEPKMSGAREGHSATPEEHAHPTQRTMVRELRVLELTRPTRKAKAVLSIPASENPAPQVLRPTAL